MMPCIPYLSYLSYLSYIPYIPYIWNVITTPTIHTIANIHAIHTIPTLHRKYSIPIIATIHTIQTIHTVISNIPCPTDLHTIPTIHTIPTTHAIHTIPTIHTKHTILSKHAIPDRPYTPYIPNIPYHTPTTPQGGRGTVPHRHHTTGGGGERFHMGPVYGTHPMGGEGGVAGAWCIHIYTYTRHYLCLCVCRNRGFPWVPTSRSESCGKWRVAQLWLSNVYSAWPCSYVTWSHLCSFGLGMPVLDDSHTENKKSLLLKYAELTTLYNLYQVCFMKPSSHKLQA